MELVLVLIAGIHDARRLIFDLEREHPIAMQVDLYYAEQQRGCEMVSLRHSMQGVVQHRWDRLRVG